MPRSSRRQRVWIDVLHSNSIVSGLSATQDILAGVPEVQSRLDRITLVRTIICHDYSYAIPDAGEGAQIVCQAPWAMGKRTD